MQRKNATRQTADMPGALRLLADETRWRLVSDLRWSDRQVGELCAQLNLPQNLVSYHLGLLRQAGLVQSHRSDADQRALYYGLNLDALHQGLRAIDYALHLASPPLAAATSSGPVLFVCTHNSARSQMAEGWLRQLSGGRVAARSAGTAPAEIHPLAMQVMAEAGIDIGHQRSKSLEAVIHLAPVAVVTVCDLAREECSAAPPALLELHWSIPDPAKATGAETERLAAFRSTRDQIRSRVQGLLTLLPAGDSSQREHPRERGHSQ
jgi:ArsR family transcriptional regulator, arsenate/arsenite/antimonite-responsive transcriptional repressor / arsenate reductase (thioredoxin)